MKDNKFLEVLCDTKKEVEKEKDYNEEKIIEVFLRLREAIEEVFDGFTIYIKTGLGKNYSYIIYLVEIGKYPFLSIRELERFDGIEIYYIYSLCENKNKMFITSYDGGSDDYRSGEFDIDKLENKMLEKLKIKNFIEYINSFIVIKNMEKRM